MQLVDSVPNGKKYIIQSPINNTHITILALKGSAYEMGVAYGKLLKKDVYDSLNGMADYVIGSMDDLLLKLKDILPFYLKWLPGLLKLAPKELLFALLDITHEVTKKYTPKRYTDEIKGIADGSGVDEKLLTRMNLFPELIRAECSMAGFWGPATLDGSLLQLRALDFDNNAYVANFPLATIYFPTEEGSNPHATFGFSGMIGAISGYSNKIAISEKVWLPTTTDPNSLFGEPFVYILRDLLQFGNDLQSSVDLIFKAPRTCTVHVGIGSRADNAFEGVEMSFKEVHIFNDKNYTYTDAHPQLDGVMFWDKYKQPSGHECLGRILEAGHGLIDAEFLFREAAPLHETGDTQVVVYDFKRETVYLSYSEPKTGAKAFVRPLIKLNMKNLLDFKTHF